MRKIALLLLVLSLLGSVSGFSQDVDLYIGEEVSFNEYSLSYTGAESGSYFEVQQEQNGEDVIVEQVPQQDLFDVESRQFNISEALEVKLTEVESDGSGVYLDLVLNSPRNIFADAELKSSAPSKVFVAQGEEVTVPLTLENTGIVNQTFRLNASHNSSMGVSFNYQDFNITKLKVRNGEEASINAKFKVPQTAEKGTYSVDMRAFNETVTRESIDIEIRQSEGEEQRRSVSLDSEQSFVGIKPGEEKQVSVRVRNEGNTILNNLEVSLDAPENWDTEISRKEVQALAEYESFRAIITVEAPANAKTGDKFLEVSASSDDTSTEEPQRIRLTVQQQSNLRYIGLGIMALSLSGLVFVYRKLGRR